MPRMPWGLTTQMHCFCARRSAGPAHPGWTWLGLAGFPPPPAPSPMLGAKSSCKPMGEGGGIKAN